MDIRKIQSRMAISLACGAFLVITVTARAGTINVNSTTDAPATATALSQGICADAQGACTLRAAVQVADRAPGASTIVVPAGTYNLTVAGVDESPSSTTSPMATVVHVPDPAIGDLNLTQSMTIIGAGAATTIIQWDPALPQDKRDRVFHVEAVSANIAVSIEGVTIKNGYTPPPMVLSTMSPTAEVEFMRFGGAIASGPAASVEVVNPQATHGQGSGGAGSEGHGGAESGNEGESGFAVDQLTLDAVHILDNEAGSDGGGIYSAAPLMLQDSILAGNIAGANGGGLYNDAAASINGTTIGSNATYTIGNSAENGGGIFDTGFHTTDIIMSAIVGNSATGGGGIAGRRLVLQNITNTTIAGNIAQDTGGGITTNGRVVLTNATVAGNIVTSDTEGGGAGLNGFGPAGGGSTGSGANGATYTLVNTILSGNVLQGSVTTAANCGATGGGPVTSRFYSLGHNLESADTCGFAGPGDLTDTNPLLEPLANNGGLTETMALASTLTTPPATQTSPAIDAGDNANCPNNDQRDSLRPADGNLDGEFVCDIGAYELYIPAADLHVNDMTSPDKVFVGDDFEVSVEVHVDPNATANSQGVQITTYPLPADLTIDSANVTTSGSASACAVANAVVTCDVGTLAPGSTATAVLTLKARNPARALTVTAYVTQSSPMDPNPANNAASVNVEAVGLSNLAVTASTAPAPAVALGTDTTIPFMVSNAGPNPASQVRVGIELPPQLAYRSITLDNATCDASDPTAILCTVDALAVGASLSGEITVSGSLVGTAAIEFATEARERDSDTSDNSVLVPRTVTQINDLALSGTLSKKRIKLGGQAALDLTLRNGGPSDATGTIVTVQIPAGLAFRSTSGGVSCTGVGAGTLACTVGSLASGQSVQFAINVTSNAGKTGKFAVSAVANSDGTDPDTSNNLVTVALIVEDSGGGGAMLPISLFVLLALAGLVGLRKRAVCRGI